MSYHDKALGEYFTLPAPAAGEFFTPLQGEPVFKEVREINYLSLLMISAVAGGTVAFVAAKEIDENKIVRAPLTIGATAAAFVMGSILLAQWGR